MTEQITVPVVDCVNCKDTVPVVIEVIQSGEWSNELGVNIPEITIIYCPQCQMLLNIDGDVEVKWYTPDELEKAGWKLSAGSKFTKG